MNTFRFLFNAYFGADLPLLPNRILVPMSAGPGSSTWPSRLGVEPDG